MRILLVVGLTVLSFLHAAMASSPKQPDAAGVSKDMLQPPQILALMRKVNDWTVAHPYIPSDRNWIRATYYTGVMGLYRATGDDRILQQALDYAARHGWAEGDNDEPVNILTVGQTYLELFFPQPDPARIAKTRAYADKLIVERERMAKQWYYCDTLYVGPPTLAMLTRATGDPKYLEYMHAAFWDTHQRLFDKDDNLFYRDARFISQKSPNGKKIFWARGNGWVVGGIVRILQHLPEDDPTRGRYTDLLRAMSAAIAKTQAPDGLWRSNLADPDHYPNAEASSTAFFTYALAWGINNGILDRERYLPVVRKGWMGLVACVSDEGKLGWVQPVGEAPEAAGPDLTHEYASGLLLLAGEEMIKLAEK